MDRKKSVQRHPGEGRDPEAFEKLDSAKASLRARPSPE
jgi:hypothetical protein